LDNYSLLLFHEIALLLDIPKKSILPFSNDDLSESVHSKFDLQGISQLLRVPGEESPGGSVATGRGDRSSRSLGSAWDGVELQLSARAPVA